VAFRAFIANHVESSGDPLFEFARVFGVDLNEDFLRKNIEIFNDIRGIVYGKGSHDEIALIERSTAPKMKHKKGLLRKIKSIIVGVLRLLP
jgi:hypothetical protein